MCLHATVNSNFFMKTLTKELLEKFVEKLTDEAEYIIAGLREDFDMTCATVWTRSGGINMEKAYLHSTWATPFIVVYDIDHNVIAEHTIFHDDGELKQYPYYGMNSCTPYEP